MSMLAMAAFLAFAHQEPAHEPPPQGQTPDSEAPRPHTTTGQQIREPKKTKDVRPKWPSNALRAGLQGVVLLECTIGPDGRVTAVKVLRGYRSLAQAATEAVEHWTYTPTLLNGVPVPVIMTVTTNFKLGGPPSLSDAMKSMADPDPEIRWAAVQWLATYTPATAKQRKALEGALQDPSPLVQKAAQLSLKKLDGSPR
jgi:TonB family protein